MKSHVTVILLLIASLCAPRAVAQADSLARVDSIPHLSPRIPALAYLGVGATALAVGTATHKIYPHRFSVTPRRERSDRATDYLMYAPLALPWVAKAAGVPTRSGWGRMAVSNAASFAIMGGAVRLTKNNVTSLRPDGSNIQSFPSGHAALSFMGATITAHELADVSPWYPMGAYALATAIAVERVLDRHHWPADVMAGAGIGIVSAELGYLIGDLVTGGRGLRDISGRDLRDNSNFSFLSLYAGLNLPVGRIRAANNIVQRLPALSAGFHGAWAFDDHWGLGLELGLVSTPLILEVEKIRTYVDNLSSLDFVVMPQYVCVLSNIFSLTADVGVGYRKNFAIDADNDAVRAAFGTPVARCDVGCVIRLANRFSAKASVGYELSHYRFSILPSESYCTNMAATARGTASSLLFSISSRYEF